jgi:hypothetical protein
LIAEGTIGEDKVRLVSRIQEVIVPIKGIPGITTTNIGDICIPGITTNITGIWIHGYITGATGICIPGLTIEIKDICTPCVTVGSIGTETIRTYLNNNLSAHSSVAKQFKILTYYVYAPLFHRFAPCSEP